MCELRVGEPVLESAIAGQEEQTFTVAIQPTCGINVRDRQVRLQRRPCAGELAQHSVWLIEEDVTVEQTPAYRKVCCERWRTAKLEQSERTCATILPQLCALAPTSTTSVNWPCSRVMNSTWRRNGEPARQKLFDFRFKDKSGCPIRDCSQIFDTAENCQAAAKTA